MQTLTFVIQISKHDRSRIKSLSPSSYLTATVFVIGVCGGGSTWVRSLTVRITYLRPSFWVEEERRKKIEKSPLLSIVSIFRTKTKVGCSDTHLAYKTNVARVLLLNALCNNRIEGETLFSAYREFFWVFRVRLFYICFILFLQL